MCVPKTYNDDVNVTHTTMCAARVGITFVATQLKLTHTHTHATENSPNSVGVVR